jgi:predicted O-methyltransferase YrrM
MSHVNARPGYVGEFWRDCVRKIYDDVREVQARKLLPLKALLSERNYEEVEGSLISPNNIDQPGLDGEIYKEKRLNYVFLINQLQPRKVLEIGFNWGYSATLVMESCSWSTLRSIDIAQHWYTVLAGELVEQLYRGRFSAVWKDSHTALRDEIAAGNRYDMIIVDGGHSYEIARLDIELSMKLLTPGGVLVVDDTDAPSVRGAVIATVARDERMVELTSENLGVFEFSNTDFPCYEQRYFMSRFDSSS